MPTLLAPKVSPEVHCKGCWIYERRVEFAETINEAFDNDGYWDYATCYFACEKKAEKRRKYNMIKSSEYYHRKIGR